VGCWRYRSAYPKSRAHQNLTNSPKRDKKGVVGRERAEVPKPNLVHVYKIRGCSWPGMSGGPQVSDGN